MTMSLGFGGHPRESETLGPCLVPRKPPLVWGTQMVAFWILQPGYTLGQQSLLTASQIPCAQCATILESHEEFFKVLELNENVNTMN